ncbi:MAG: hypothetical protein R3190_18980, partial [Thermoanaerobaculia bacterium]|nr:hypothetical protein [Thermoanaerobaculia bacterium]
GRYRGLGSSAYASGEIESEVASLGAALYAVKARATLGGRGREVSLRARIGPGSASVLEWSRSTFRAADGAPRR